MELYFLRHGLAGQHGDPKYKDDSLRPLTDEGVEKIKKIAQGMQALGLKFDGILSSPYLRAQQTAQIVARAYKMDIQLTDNLKPSGSLDKLLKEVRRRFPQAQGIVLTGHEPDLSAMVSGLLGSKDMPIDFKKGGICCVSVENDTATLNWLVTPGQLILMAKAKR